MRRDSQIMPFLLISGAAAGFTLAAIIPAHHRLGLARAEVRRIQGEIGSSSARLAALESLNREVVALRAKTAAFEAAIPTHHALGDFLENVATIVERNGLQNHIFQPRPAHPVEAERLPANFTAALGGLQVQPVLIQCEGQFDSLFDSLKEIEKLPRLSEIDRLKVTGDPTRPGRVKVEILLNTFFRSAGTTSGGGTS